MVFPKEEGRGKKIVLVVNHGSGEPELALWQEKYSWKSYLEFSDPDI